MGYYLLRRLLLLPMTLGCILLVNFVIIHLVPGDPATLSSMGDGSGGAPAAKAQYGGEHNRQFRMRYGLTLPLVWNSWVFLATPEVEASITQALENQDRSGLITLKDQSPYILRQLLVIMRNEQEPEAVRKTACQLFLQGSIKLIPTRADSKEYQEIEAWNAQIDELREKKSFTDILAGIDQLNFVNTEPAFWQKIFLSFKETQLVQYLSRVLRLDFGTRRNDPYVPVVDVVMSKLCYSLTLAALPYFGTFFLAIIFGLYMAARSGHVLEGALDVVFLILFAIPVFVIAPYFLEKAIWGLTIPWTDIKLPLRGFCSDPFIYEKLTSFERLKDIGRHLILPILCLSYNLLAVQARLAKASFIEASSQEYVRFAISKGVGVKRLWLHHILPNGAIPLVTMAAGSLGVLLGGSVIVETLFEIPGFGKFFYDAIIERDYNVLLFSAIAGSALTLVGYLVADIVYCLLDPRVDFEKRST